MITKKMITKNACPFCGRHSTQTVHVAQLTSNPETSCQTIGFQIECMNCGARGPGGMPDIRAAGRGWDKGDTDYRRPFVADGPQPIDY